MQAYFGDKPSLSHHSASAEVVQPIVDPSLWSDEGAGRRPGTAVIGFGGKHVPTPGGDELVERYTRWFLGAALPILLDHPQAVKGITIVGGRVDLEISFPRNGRMRCRYARAWSRPTTPSCSARLSTCCSAPGLGSLYECASTRLQPLLQPGWNLSMLLQAFHVTRTSTATSGATCPRSDGRC